MHKDTGSLGDCSILDADTTGAGKKDARSFEQPDEFIPERWTNRPDLIKNKSVFIPFNIGALPSLFCLLCPFPHCPLPASGNPCMRNGADEARTKGPYACVGKRLAMLEVRRVVGELFSRYDIALTPGHTREEFLGGKQDTFTVVSAPLPLVFTPRPFNERS